MVVSEETDIRLEATSNEDEYKVWLTDDELEELRRVAATHRDTLTFQLGGYVGLRAFEIPQIKPTHIKRPGDGEHYRLRAPSGKTPRGTAANRATPTSRRASRAACSDIRTPRMSRRTPRSSTSRSAAFPPS